MTSEVIPLSDTKLRSTTVRVRPELLRKARFFLDERGKKLQDFLAESLEDFVEQCEREQAQTPIHARREMAVR